MIWLAWLRKAPKLALVLFIIIGSTIAFGIWWARHSAEKKAAVMAPVVQDDTRRKVAEIESTPENILFVDNSLYNIQTGEALFRGWLKDDKPQKLFWEPDSRTILTQHERGFIRYTPDGTEKARFVLTWQPVISTDYKWLLYSRNKDIWRADIDWETLALRNERKLTNVEQFNDAGFAGNVLFGSDKTLIVRAERQVVRVNIETGDVHPTRLPLLDIYKRKSPNGHSIVGVENGNFYCYDLDSDLAKEVPVGRFPVNDYQWLDDNKCACLVNARAIVLYDRLANSLNEIATLPTQCVKIGVPSPDGRFFFGFGRGKGVLIDLKQKIANPVVGGAGLHWIDNETFAFTREVPDSTLRGTWLQKPDESERRISPEPYLASNSGGGEILFIKADQMIVFATQHGVFTSNFAGDNAKQIVSLTRPPALVLGLLERR